MKTFLMGSELAEKIAKVLGISVENCTGLVLSMEAGEMATVRAGYLIEGKNIEKVYSLLTETTTEERLDANNT